MPEVERYIRSGKERTWAIINTLPFEILPHLLIVEIVYNTIFWLNCFPEKHVIHPTLSLRTIVTGSKLITTNSASCNLVTYNTITKQSQECNINMKTTISISQECNMDMNRQI